MNLVGGTLDSSTPDSVLVWNSLGPEIRNIKTLSGFKNKLLKIIKPEAHSIFKIHDPDNLKYLFQLRVGLSQLKSHKKIITSMTPQMIFVTVARELSLLSISC